MRVAVITITGPLPSAFSLLSKSKGAGLEYIEVLCVVRLKRVPARKRHVIWTRPSSLQAISWFSIELTSSGAFARRVNEGARRVNEGALRLSCRTCDAFDNVSTGPAMGFLQDRLTARHRRIDARRTCSSHKWYASIPSGAPIRVLRKVEDFDTPLR